MRDLGLAHDPLVRFLRLIKLTPMRRPPLRMADQLYLIVPGRTSVCLILAFRPRQAEVERAREVCSVALGRCSGGLVEAACRFVTF